jgi:hypothetical protein
MGTGWAAGGAPVGRRRLGEVLVAGQVLTEAQLDEALRVQRGDKGRRRRLGEVITALGLADEVQIARALSDQLGLPFLDLGSMPIPDETLAVLPRNVGERAPPTWIEDSSTRSVSEPVSYAGYANLRSPASSSSTGRAQVGQYQRASRGVPQARWRRPSASGAPERSAPHWASRRRAPASSRPAAVSS